MLGTFDHRYTTNTGRLIFVPSNAGRTDGEKVIRRVLKRWAPPKYFYHLRDGGHIAAMRAHLANTVFVTMDLQGFYDSITRTKVHRAMRSIGYGQRVALEVAQRATVRKPGLSGYSLPFGFVQSPILASVVLDTSALGRTLRDLGAHSITVSVYMDDILLSGRDTAALIAARDELAEAARVAGLSFQSREERRPSAHCPYVQSDIKPWHS